MGNVFCVIINNSDVMNKPSIKRNYIYQVLFRIISMIIPVITIPYLSRVLGTLNIGILCYFRTFCTKKLYCNNYVYFCIKGKCWC